uniref:Uncharacterized protein n=1 Tax=Romanomermis culicivorax TaxID=13658 RepID=A0A915K4Q1_ROMCU
MLDYLALIIRKLLVLEDSLLRQSNTMVAEQRYDQSCDLGYRYDRGATIGHQWSHMTNQLCPTH